jgi:hypothetical protein
MSRKENSTIVIARLNVNFGRLREVQQRRSGREHNLDHPTAVTAAETFRG